MEMDGAVEQIHLRECTLNLRREIGNISETFAAKEAVDVTEAMSMLIAMKEMNRAAQLASEAYKANIETARKKTNRMRIELENLQYERDMIQREIAECAKEGRGGPLDELKILGAGEDDERDRNAFELIEISSPRKRKRGRGGGKSSKRRKVQRRASKDNQRDREILANTAHEKMLERLDSEMKERLRMLEEVRRLQEEKQKLESSNRKGAAFLKDLPKHVERIKGVVAPIRSFFFSNASATPPSMPREQIELFKQLAPPLYVLAREAVSYRSVFKRLEVKVVETGSQAEPLSKTEGATEEQLHLSHPKTVHLTVEMDKGVGQSAWRFPLIFYYFPLLKIVACSLVGSETSRLANLFPHDNGQESPNPSNAHLMSGKFRFKQEMAHGAMPFLWANLMCGLRYMQLPTTYDLPESSAHWPREAANKPSHLRFATIVDALRTRIAAIEARVQELKVISSTKLASEWQQAGWSSRPRTELKSWKSSAFLDKFQDPDIALAFEAQFVNPKMVVSALIGLRNEYPIASPIFKLEIEKSMNIPSPTGLIIRELEKEVNAITESRQSLLTEQLTVLMKRLDNYMEEKT